ncbi:MAG: DUF86 domain-containing protein [Candidatus Heimdallarchaeota archaeon]
MSFDPIRIKDKLNQSKEYLLIINKILEMEVSEFENNLEQKLVAERAFEIISQIILDVCTHIVAKQKLNTPLNYADCITKLVDEGILHQTHQLKFQNLVRMRNLIVHQYVKIDHEILFNALRSLNDDYITFQKSILNWIHHHWSTK